MANRPLACTEKWTWRWWWMTPRFDNEMESLGWFFHLLSKWSDQEGTQDQYWFASYSKFRIWMWSFLYLIALQYINYVILNYINKLTSNWKLPLRVGAWEIQRAMETDWRILVPSSCINKKSTNGMYVWYNHGTNAFVFLEGRVSSDFSALFFQLWEGSMLIFRSRS